jgi:esterase/lipase superfamily enzyme
MPDHTVYFATNRNPISGGDGEGKSIIDFGDLPGGVDGHAVRYGRVKVKFKANKPNRLTDLQVAPENLTSPPPVEGEGNRDPGFLLGSSDILETVRKTMQSKKQDVLLVIHGYANTFESGILGSAEAAHSLQYMDNPTFAFTWPSNGELLHYFLDKPDAKASARAVARSIRRLVEFLSKLSADQQCGQKVHVLAHSMGNYVLRHAIQAFLEIGGGIRPHIFSQILLVGADDDADALAREDKLRPICAMADRVSVFYTNEDALLVTSDRFKFQGDRLGHRGPENMNTVPDNVYAVDVSVWSNPFPFDEGHNYHRSIPEVGAQMGRLLRGVAHEDIETWEAIDSTGRRLKIKKPKSTTPKRKSSSKKKGVGRKRRVGR